MRQKGLNNLSPVTWLMHSIRIQTAIQPISEFLTIVLSGFISSLLFTIFFWKILRFEYSTTCLEQDSAWSMFMNGLFWTSGS